MVIGSGAGKKHPQRTYALSETSIKWAISTPNIPICSEGRLESYSNMRTGLLDEADQAGPVESHQGLLCQPNIAQLSQVGEICWFQFVHLWSRRKLLSSILLPSEFVSCYSLVILGFSLQFQRWSSPVSGPLASWNCSFVLLVYWSSVILNHYLFSISSPSVLC